MVTAVCRDASLSVSAGGVGAAPFAYRLPTHALALTGTPSFSAHAGRSDMIRPTVSLAIFGCSTTISSCTVKTIG